MSWNRYVFKNMRLAKRTGASTLGFLFRLPDRVLGKPSSSLQSSLTSAQARSSDRFVVHAAHQPPKRVSDVFVSFSASPLMQSARAAKQGVYNRLNAENIQNRINQGRHKASSLWQGSALSARRTAAEMVYNKDLIMANLRRIRSSWGQNQGFPSY